MGNALHGRVALVTGGTRGIGRGIAEAFLAEGARVMLSGRSEAKGAQALAEIGRGEQVDFTACDARDRAQVNALVERTIARFGQVDILVNNAGGSDGFALVHEMTDEAWDNALALGLNTTFWATRRALADMVTRRWGRIINITSVEGKVGNKSAVSHYTSNKAGMHGFTKAVAAEYGTMGITSNAICPGAIETDMMKEAGVSAAASMGITYAQFLDSYAQESLIKRLNTVEEVAAMALLLATDVGAGITGGLLNVDGGTSPY
jgi:3-hydroxybutyrate dehydrogenase/3-oxoacyl-[acyl-carrier protein] reductase